MIKKVLVFTFFCVSLFAMQGVSLVQTSKIVKDEVNPLQEFIGTIQFDRKSVLAAQNQGVIEKLNFDVASKVKKNQILVQIDADILNAQIKSAKANALTAKKDFQRYTKLLENKSISQKDYDDIKLRYITTKSFLQELEIQASKKSVKAPYNSIVIKRHVDLGEWVNAGTAIATVVDTSKIKITFDIPLSVYEGLKKDEIYDIKVANNIIKAKLIAAIPSGDKLTRTFPVKFEANIEDKFVFDGQEAKVSLSKNKKTQALIVPRDAVIKRFGQNVVFVVTEKMTASMIPVQIVAYLKDKIAIQAQGLDENMSVVSKGNERVFPNSPVKVLNKQ